MPLRTFTPGSTASQNVLTSEIVLIINLFALLAHCPNRRPVAEEGCCGLIYLRPPINVLDDREIK
jgi:hypothetical protein